MYATTPRMRRHAFAGRILGAAADRLAALSRAHVGASLDREIRDHAFPLLTDSHGLSFPITDRQSLNHFLVYGPKSAARSRLLLDIAESKIKRGSGLIHVSTHDGAMTSEIQERTRSWPAFRQDAVVVYSGDDRLENRSMLGKVFDDCWRVFVRLPDPVQDAAAARAAAEFFCADLREIGNMVGQESTAGHWRRWYNLGAPSFQGAPSSLVQHAPTPIVFDDASWFVGGLGDRCGLLAAQLKAMGFSIVHGLESDAAFGTHDKDAAARVLANAMTSVMMGDEIEVVCGRTRMPRLGPDFFQAAAANRDRRGRPRMELAAAG